MLRILTIRAVKPSNPHQSYLFPPARRNWLSHGHLAHFTGQAVHQHDLPATFPAYKGEERGQPANRAVIMPKVWLYAYTRGIHCSHWPKRALYEDVVIRMLSGKQRRKRERRPREKVGELAGTGTEKQSRVRLTGSLLREPGVSHRTYPLQQPLREKREELTYAVAS